MKQNVTCTVCPMGCRMTLTKVNEEYKIEGNNCKRGAKYALEEISNPKRVITSTVRIEGSYLKLLPVKTDGAVPKSLMMKVMAILDKVKVQSPIEAGDIIVKDILGTGVNIISTKKL